MPVLTDTSVQGVERAIIEYCPDCTVISSYDRILNAQILDLSRFVNVHYSLLPRYRGMAAVQWGIINGEPEFGITIHVITKDLDAGNILYQERITADPDEIAGDIYSKLNEIQRRTLGETVERYLGGYAGVPQGESAATYACARTPEDSEINWSDSTAHLCADPDVPRGTVDSLSRGLHISRDPPDHDHEGDTRSGCPALCRTCSRPRGAPIQRRRLCGCSQWRRGLRIHEVMTDDSVVQPASAVIRSTQQTLGLRTADLLERIDELSRQLDQFLTRPGPVPHPDGTHALA